MFSSHVVPVSLSDNETKVEEDRGIISFDKVVVSETQDGELKTYIKISNCRPIESH